MANFRKTLDFQRLHKGQVFRKLSIKQWLSKWDRTIAAITAIIIFFMLLSFVIVNIENENEINVEDSNNIFNQYNNQLLNKNSEICIISENTKVTCTSAKSEELVQNINTAIEEKPVKNYNDLNLVKITFKNNKIEKGWLDGIKLNLTTLTITNCQLFELGEKAFSGDVFNNLKTLTISDTVINTFRRNIFEESQITTLRINYGTMVGSSFEENAFGALEQTLNTLQLQGCLSHNVLLNITGPQTSLTSLSVLDLRNNNLGKIQASSFSKTPNLKQLFMSDSMITEIEPNTFDFLYLKMLDLRNNKMTILPEHIFDYVERGISINYNPWMCNCELLWLKDLFELNTELFTDEFYCSTSEGSKYYKDVDFCSDTNSTEVSLTLEPTTTPRLSAQIVLRNEEDSTLTSDLEEPTDVYEVFVRKGRVTMNFTQTADSYHRYTLTIKGDINNQSTLWGPNTSTIGCPKPIIGGLQYEITVSNEGTYLFCFLEPSQDTASPFDCSALTTPPALEDQTWITNKLKMPLIIAIGGSLLAAVLMSGIIVFYCIRQHPNLIKGNKRVIMVESQAADAIVMPKTYDEVNYRPPSLNSRSNGYLTPRYNRVYNPQHVRTVSEHTAFVIPTESCKKGHYRRRTRVEHVTESFNDHVYEPPPPLPPNHPSEMRKFDRMNYSRQ
ncbi:leucine-rich repeat-containing protein 4C [Tribolium castaneum]